MNVVNNWNFNLIRLGDPNNVVMVNNWNLYLISLGDSKALSPRRRATLLVPRERQREAKRKTRASSVTRVT